MKKFSVQDFLKFFPNPDSEIVRKIAFEIAQYVNKELEGADEKATNKRPFPSFFNKE